jgi:phospholipid/cholesterol/gamma-HCH transport system substrate-binding protein
VKNVSAAVRVAILFILLVVAAYFIWKNLGKNPAGSDNQILFARFRDASGLPKGSKVLVAGLSKGEVIDLKVEGRYARVTFRLSKDIPVWTSGFVAKKASSLLGENYLEVDPGEQFKQAADGTTQTFTPLGDKVTDKDGKVIHEKCPNYDSDDIAKQDACREIKTVVEATTVDQLLHRIELTLPNVDRVLDSVRDLSEDLRRVVNGPLNSVATRVDGLVQKNADAVNDIIARADNAAKNLERLSNDLRGLSNSASPKVQILLDNLDQASADAKDLVATAKKELQDTGDKLRGKLDKFDGVIDNTRSITKKIDEGNGTLGQLVNNPAIADNIEQITDDAKGFLGTLFTLKAYVGLRSEYNFGAGLARHYLSVELHTRPDKFYLIELEKGPRGDYPDVTLTFDPTVDPNHWIRRAVIHDQFRFTFQFAKRFGAFTLRYGLKESTGGIGVDYDMNWWERNLRLTIDAFDATWDKYPRVKITAAYEVFRHIYVLGGVDELLNAPQNLPIVTGDSGVPVQFSTFRYGRDYFLGGMLRFNDEDLSALLTVGGSAITGAAK